MPTFGLVSRAGVITNSYTFDHCGPLGRTVEDCALALQALAGYDGRTRAACGGRFRSIARRSARICAGLRIGVLRHHWEDDVPASEDVKKAMDAALGVLRGLGAELEECRVRPLASYFDVKIIIAESEIFSVHAKDLIAGQRLRRRLSLPRASVRALLRQRLRPGHPRAPPDDGGDGAAVRQVRRLRHGRHGRSSAAHGLPQRLVLAEAQPLHAMERHGPARARLPNGFGRSGLPLGMQILGRPFGETTILRVGHAYEQATEWHTRRPALVPGADAPAVTPPPILSEHRRSRPTPGCATYA